MISEKHFLDDLSGFHEIQMTNSSKRGFRTTKQQQNFQSYQGKIFVQLGKVQHSSTVFLS